MKSDRVLEELLRTALENTSKTYVVIDGLDECEKSERTKILGWFIPTIKSMAPGGMRGVFISRDEYDINKKLSKARKRRIDTKDTSNDMEVYLQTLSKEVQQKFRLSDSRRSEIVSTVFTRAEGTYQTPTYREYRAEAAFTRDVFVQLLSYGQSLKSNNGGRTR